MHSMRQGEGDEQKDLMPFIFAERQQSAVDAVQEEVQEREVLLAL